MRFVIIKTLSPANLTFWVRGAFGQIMAGRDIPRDGRYHLS